MKLDLKWFVLLLAPILGSAATLSSFAPCADPAVQQLRSKELQDLYNADQSDYRKELETHPDQPIDVQKLQQMAVNDLERRKRVGEIFGEGCFHIADDYSAAAMIYQHGDVPDHYFQAFIWAKSAVSLGDAKEKSVMAIAIDRYLVHTGQKQLFGSQANKPSGSSACWCLEPVEMSFPDSVRKEYHGKDLSEDVAWLQSLNGSNNCPEVYCKSDLKPSPKGTVPGFW